MDCNVCGFLSTEVPTKQEFDLFKHALTSSLAKIC
jgi:hypothetical protein